VKGGAAAAVREGAWREWAELGVATVYEASGRHGLVDVELTQLIPGSRVAGPALPVMCGQDDNLMVHACVEQVMPGDVVVLAMPEPAPVALVGELLATQLKLRGAAALLVDASVRDFDELVALGLPVWTRWVRVRGADKRVVGSVGEPVTIGGARVRRGDIVVLDRDGAVVVAQERADEVLHAARARAEKERSMRERLAAGEISYDIHGLRKVVEGG
jgi:4-hydroxy-4-methyl-2-oxoglutarate aldolase